MVYLCDKFELSESTFVDAAAAARCLGEKYDVILLPTVFEALSLGAAVSWKVQYVKMNEKHERQNNIY